MAKKTSSEAEQVREMLGAFTPPVPSVKEVVEKRREVNNLEQQLRELEMMGAIGKGDPEKQAQLMKEFNLQRIELDGMESAYFAQGIKGIDKEDDAEIQQLTRIENRMQRLKLENDLIIYDISHGGKEDYTQLDENEAQIRNLKLEHGAIEAKYYSEQSRLAEREGKIEITPQQDKSYQMTVVVGGKAYNSTLSEQQHDKLMALNDTQKLNYISTLIPSANIKEQSAETKATMLTSLKDSLYNLPKPEVYASAPQQQEQPTRQMSGAVLAAANFEGVAQQETTERSQSMGMGR